MLVLHESYSWYVFFPLYTYILCNAIVSTGCKLTIFNIITTYLYYFLVGEIPELLICSLFIKS